MRPVLTFFLMPVLCFAGIGAALAQDRAATAPAPVTATEPDTAKKIELAKRMHEIRPAKAQVQEALDQVGRNLPPMERDKFLKMVDGAFDYAKLEKLSIDTMVELFTVAELEKMVDYFGSPEANTIATKLPEYQKKIQPEIIRSLDAAMMSQRTGAAAPPVSTSPVAPAETSKP